MLIGLDYDGTFTEDPGAWLSVVRLLKAHGHEVVVVTMRYPSEAHNQIDARLLLLCEVICTSRQAKEPSMLAQFGRVPNVWIDDHPAAVHLSAAELWGVSTPEGNIVTTNALSTTSLLPVTYTS